MLICRGSSRDTAGHWNPPWQALPACKEKNVEVSYQSAEARVRAIRWLPAERLSAFVRSLVSQQYSAGYACDRGEARVELQPMVSGAWHRVRTQWSTATSRGTSAIATRRRSRCSDTRRQERQALTLLLAFLRDAGICAATAASTTAVDPRCRRLRSSTCGAIGARADHGRVLHEEQPDSFLDWRFRRAEVCLADIRPTDAIAFVQARVEAVGDLPP
jgi:hypothetical protein